MPSADKLLIAGAVVFVAYLVVMEFMRLVRKCLSRRCDCCGKIVRYPKKWECRCGDA
jgi:hypothetical protein